MKADLAKTALRAAPAAALVLLSACGGSKPAKSEDQRTAAGQILPGSISDAMLPYDATTSTAPLAPRKVEAGEGAGEEAASGAESSASSAASTAVSGAEPVLPAPSIDH